ncbi:MAG TPA: hypothetical protein VFZ65_18765 [Planctomycetota bacterium]|nr:hypothetical protein [Planctomycetota bacterium]
MFFLDKTLDEARDRQRPPHLQRWLAAALALLVVAAGTALLWSRWETPATAKARAKAARAAEKARASVPAQK